MVVGEAWSVIAGTGPFFRDVNNPQPVVRVGDPNSQGAVEITDMIFTTIGPGTFKLLKVSKCCFDKLNFTAPGAIVVEWNVAQPSGHNGGAGMWDSHIRLGGGKPWSTFTSQINC